MSEAFQSALVQPITRLGTVWPVVAAAMLAWAAAHAQHIWSWMGSWFDPMADMQHGPAVPLVIAFLAWTERAQILELPAQPKLSGLTLTAIGILQTSFAVAVGWTFVLRIGMILTAAGCLATLCGWDLLKRLRFYFFLLLFAVPPPTFLYAGATLQLQLLASRIGAAMLDALGFSVLREGNVLDLGDSLWAVEDACGGIRSSIGIAFFFVMYTHLFVPRRTVRALVFAALVPMVVAANVVRIVLAVMVQRNEPASAQWIMHEVVGYAMNTAAVAAGIVICCLLNSRFPSRASRA